MLRLTFTLGCANNHRVEVPETEGQNRNLQPCPECGKPMFVQRLNVAGEASPAVGRRCPVHADNDPCCWRQNGWRSSLHESRKVEPV
jgi:hypothetical protein